MIKINQLIKKKIGIVYLMLLLKIYSYQFRLEMRENTCKLQLG